MPCETYTAGGNAKGAICKFPFNYYGKDTYECITENNNGVPWCATTYDYTTDYIWGNCAGMVRHKILMLFVRKELKLSK